MPIIDPSPHDPPTALWQVLGEIQLPVGANLDHEIQRWMTLIVRPLELSPDLFSKLLGSAQRATQAESIVKAEHIHLCVLALTRHAENGQTWGFFRIERLKAPSTHGGPSVPPVHAIEFYLYLEGAKP